ncbi:hypothetical protein A0J52_14235 [Clostridium sporogenes]|uniref:transglutaminase domain-containing protein n=1 Tax=Clostridium sporogenes TaxID=1509 RepID=UPI0007800C4F|nr:transglutaminase domain-containing protein [Clostridium sporogenes]KYN76816.1 hypothetical protein A0J52_14235 [Clostridium sporogenes]MCW6061182.1 hypothetical protein [Clostridium sporogenes]MCW6069261.1 hypothetical protein [Clostridium sporogenes]NFM19190.1 hypothetical protein [Clostridium sporogenes]
MYRKRLKLKTVCVFILVLFINILFISCKGGNSNKGIIVEKWDNFYEGNNIHFYYSDGKSPNPQQLKSKYSLDKLTSKGKDDIDKALKITSWLNNKLKFSKNSIKTEDDPLTILEKYKEGETVSDKEFNEIFTEAISSVGIYSRIGEFRVKDAQHSKKDDFFMVSEIWSDKYKKWIMIDVVNSCYMKKAGVPLSAIEVLNNGISNLEVNGVKDKNKYIKKMERYFYSYTIGIDNNIHDGVKSNSYITYISKGQVPELKTIKGYIKPTIFVNNDSLFTISPKTQYKDLQNDKKPTLIISKKNTEGKEEETPSFYVASFKDSVMVKEFYISVNGADFGKVNNIFELKLKEGQNSIKLSENGKDVPREVIVNYKK